MDDFTLRNSGSWQEWLMVFGYVSFLAIVMWRVLLAQKKE